jgi:signal transduction histidine kinase
MGVPLIAHDEIIGLLNITRHQANFYNQHDAQVALAFANQAATAMENARLYERLRHYAQDLETQVAARTRELAEANEQLKELDRLKTKFVSDVSHELRTPVTNLKLYLNLLDRGDPQKQERYLSVINEQTERLEELIKSILDLSRLETNRDELLFQPVNLNELVGYAVASFKRRAELAGLIFQVDLASSLPLIYGNPSQLKQVIENLLTNAIHYTAAGEVLVSTYYDAEHGMVCLQVTDTGMGIDESELSLLFERFYRGERTSQSNIPGTGLGLSIVKEILALHNGRIEVQSELHQGSTFRVWLPISNQ